MCGAKRRGRCRNKALDGREGLGPGAPVDSVLSRGAGKGLVDTSLKP